MSGVNEIIRRPAGRLRVSDADRDAAVAELSDHFQAGRLDTAEFDDRAGRALRARVGSDLDELLADLPRRLAAHAEPPARSRPPLPLVLLPVLAAAVLVTAIVAGGAAGGSWHHQWGLGMALWWLVPLMALRLLWWRRGGIRRWR